MPHPVIPKPDPSEYPEWAAAEIVPVPFNDLIPGLEKSARTVFGFLRSIPQERMEYRYAAGKWTIKQLWQHVMDTERVMSYRALRYARQDETVLSRFDGDRYVELSGAEARPLEEMLEEYQAIRASTVALFKSFTPAMTLHRGQAGQTVMSVRAVGYLILGHEIHHVGVIKEKYLSN